jgi:hypothetical protein
MFISLLHNVNRSDLAWLVVGLALQRVMMALFIEPGMNRVTERNAREFRLPFAL